VRKYDFYLKIIYVVYGSKLVVLLADRRDRISNAHRMAKLAALAYNRCPLCE